jgi:hypothetical protein
MDFESTTLFFNTKDLPAVAIHVEINSVLGEGTIGYSTVTRYSRKQSFARALHLAQRSLISGRLTELTMLFCKRLTNTLLRHFARLPRGR